MSVHDSDVRSTAGSPLQRGELRVVVRQGPTSVVVTAAGDLDLNTAPRLRVAIAGRAQARQDLVLDLVGLTFMDSSGVHLLLSAQSHARRHRTRLQVVIGPVATRVLEVCGLTGHFEVTTELPGTPDMGSVADSRAQH